MIEKMKRNYATWLFTGLCAGLLTLFAACHDTIDDPTEEELQLSIPVKQLASMQEVATADTVYTFDVLKSSGAFKVKVGEASKYATPKVTVNGQHVTIGLLAEFTYVTVTDEAGQEISFNIHSSHEDLLSQSNVYYVWYGCTFHYPKFKYGLGNMRVLSGNDNKRVASVSFDENNELKIESEKNGSSYFTVADGRGVARSLQVVVEEGYDMTTDSLEVTSTNPSTIYFPIKYGKRGGWKLVDSSEHRPTDFVIHLPSGNVDCDYDLLHVYINQAYAAKQYKYYLENEDGSKGVVVVNVVKKK
uniref:Uncharacterized protein n=2 Tax=unclassified Prevotella TaxID=2638335 RepID=A0AB33IRY4_9BACT